MADPTAAARQARRRARIAAQADHQGDTLQALVVAVRDLGRKVDNLAQAVGKRDVTAAQRDVTVRGRGRARTGTGVAPAPTGPGGHLPVTVSRVTDQEELAASVLAALSGHGANAVGAIRDALGEARVPLGDVAAALVQLQSHGLVLREEGDQAVQRPDRWRAVDGALARLDSLDSIVAPRLQVTPTLDLHVTCQDYQAHHASHAWDAALGAFRCATCSPMAAMAAPSPQGGLTNGHA